MLLHHPAPPRLPMKPSSCTIADNPVAPFCPFSLEDFLLYLQSIFGRADSSALCYIQLAYVSFVKIFAISAGDLTSVCLLYTKSTTNSKCPNQGNPVSTSVAPPSSTLSINAVAVIPQPLRVRRRAPPGYTIYDHLRVSSRRDTGRKVEDPELLEAIRLTIINNMIQYHPESSAQLAMGVAFGVVPPEQQVDVDVATHIRIYDDGPDRSLLYVETADRPGLLVDLVKIITDINVDVKSGEFDTQGLLTKAKFLVNYKDKAIIKPLQQVLGNSLRYFLR